MKNTLRSILMMLVIAALVAACSPATEEPVEPAPVEEAAPEVEEAPAVEEAAEVEEAPSEPVEIAFWYPYGEGSWTGDFLAGKIESFNAEKPDIIVTGQSYESYTAIIEGLQRAAAGENLPGVASIGFGFDEYIVSSDLAASYNELLGDEAEAYLGDFFPALTAVTTFDGETYGVPLALSVAEIFYHSDLFEQAGLDPDNPPTTWAGFLEAARTINTELGIYGATFALDDPWIFETTVRSNGGAFLTEEGPQLNSDVASAALTDWGTGVADGSILYNADFFETLQSFGAQQVAMFATSSYGTLIYAEIAPLVRAMPWPAAEGETAQIPAGGNSLYVFGNSDAERAAAAELVLYLTSPEANAEWAMNSGYLPTRNSSLETMGDFISGFDNYQIAIDAIDNVVPPTQFGTQTLQANQYLMEAIEKVMLGAGTADEVLAEANQSIVELLAE
ncbi:MAG: ABC transporter substrate-binding protein [Anaerolineales bacterium]|nr:ABC transporter substrate-binding protein [Anaerolineales bacterium]